MGNTDTFFSDLHSKFVKGFIEHLDYKGNTTTSSCYDFTETCMTEEELTHVLDILTQKSFLILPQTDLMGFIKNYVIYDQEGTPLLAFSGKNLPQGKGLRDIFARCHDDHNILLLQTLQREKSGLNFKNILPAFEHYYY